jgi:hypothetical protein
MGILLDSPALYWGLKNFDREGRGPSLEYETAHSFPNLDDKNSEWFDKIVKNIP